MVSIICCKVEASHSSDPCVPCLVLLITSNYSIVNAGGSNFTGPTMGVKCYRLLTLVGLGSGLRVEAIVLGIVEPRC